MTTPKQSPNLSRTDTFKPEKGYVEVTRVQGAPELDTDMNDAQQYMRRSVNQLGKDVEGWADLALSPLDFQVRPVTHDAATTLQGIHPRNYDNMALSLGRMHTRLGLVDTGVLRDPLLYDFVVYDYQLLVDQAAQDARDRPHGNYLFRGKVTVGGHGLNESLVDENKLWTADHHLTGIVGTALARGTAGDPVGSSWDAANPNQIISDFQANFSEPAARVVFLTGAAAGDDIAIDGLTSSTELLLADTTSGALSEGDEYVIVPGNALEAYRALYDAQATAGETEFPGLTRMPAVLSFVHVFNEDVSADEDPDLPHPTLGIETSHRKQLRWCLRNVLVYFSEEADAGRSGLHRAHVKNLLASKIGRGELPFYMENVGELRGGPGTVEDGYDTLLSVPHGGTSPVPSTGLDKSPFGAFLTRHHNTFRDFNQTLWPFLQMLAEELLSDWDNHALAPLLLHTSPPKNTDNPEPIATQTLSPYWYADVTVAAWPATTDNPRMAIVSSGDVAGAGLRMSAYIAPDRMLSSPAEMSSELERARGLSWGAPSWQVPYMPISARSPYESLLFDEDGPYAAPLLFRSLSHHLGFLDMWVLGATGLGGGIGHTLPYANVPSARVPTNQLYVPAGETETLTQSGQSNRTFLPGNNNLLNPSASLHGSVFPPDLLSGTSAVAADPGSNWLGSWVSGPGQYKLRDGTVVSASAQKGWSFYAGTFNDYDDDYYSNFSVRAWDEGPSQALMMQRGLAFRKLAVKASYHREADLMTIDVRHPTDVTEPASGGVGTYLGSVVRDWLDPAGYGVSGLGALQRPSEQTNANAGNRARQTGLSSYDAVGLYGSGAYPSPFRGWARDPDVLVPDDPRGSQAAERWVYDGAGGGGFDGANGELSPRGAWGRWTTSPDNNNGGGRIASSDKMDQWSNRCTALRLRYHVGDYYPGPLDDKGVPQNALVDTMQLFVRVEPLPLVHWLTLPKHQHTIIESSLSHLDALQRALSFVVGRGTDDEMMSTDPTPVALVGPESPALDPGVIDVGDNDPLNLPFAYEHQLYVHWYHPLMDQLTAPFPYQTNYSRAPVTGQSIVAYHKFGERSLIVPSLVYSEPVEQPAGAHGDELILPTDVADSTFLDNLSGDSDPNGDGGGGESYVMKKGTHANTAVAASASYAFTIGGQADTAVDREQSFPFIPREITDWDADGYPGPVMIPAYRAFAQADRTFNNGLESIFGAGHVFTATTEAQLTSLGILDEKNYFPEIDDNAYGADGLGLVWGKWDTWKLPVLRAALRTDTVAAVIRLVKTGMTDLFPVVFDDGDPLEPTDTQSDTMTWTPGVSQGHAPMGGPDTNTDTAFVGGLGTGVVRDTTAHTSRNQYWAHPLLLGFTADTGQGYPTANADSRAAVITDIWQLCQLERQLGFDQGGLPGAKFVPLLNTWIALRDQGLQQKLLWNSSLRVLHTRPGGGFEPGGTGPVGSSLAPLSLTELFLVRNRQNGTASPWPVAPLSKDTKPFIHLESIHPAAAGGSGFNQHPNYPYVGHLYPMISDTTGGGTASVSGDDLSLNDTDADHSIAASDFTDDTFKMGPMGDTFVGDPFDWEYGKYNATATGNTNRTPRTDRLTQNSGIEIDLVSELRYVRANAAAHGLTLGGFGGITLLDMMPSVGDLTAPGDHEIVFILYPGRFGQKMIDGNVPDGYNPPVAGCHLVVDLEINRPGEKTSSMGTEAGNHYGENRRVFNVLGHS